MNQSEGTLASLGKPANPMGRAQPVEPDATFTEMEGEEAREAIPWRGQTVEQVSKDFVLTQVDPQQPEVRERLWKRGSSGRYEISEAHVVLGIRAFVARGDHERARLLSEVLLDRCQGEFQRRSLGLRHRPDLMEDAMAGMAEQVLREAMDPREEFMILNFTHYLRCLCADNFNAVLRQEGLRYRRDEEGRPAGRPTHVPAALVDRIHATQEEEESGMGASGARLADPSDDIESFHAIMEARRVLTYLADPLDRTIVTLRALEGLKWDEIARLCGKTERTMRLRYERARAFLRECIEREAASEGA
ncbi:MAG TPA: sigma factor-like helix-turn-helix DNA-binding protein [Ktedonobacterales bacterium]